MNTTRVCKKCEIDKPLESFEKSPRYRDSRMPVCRDCRKAYKEVLYAKPKKSTGEMKFCLGCQAHIPVEAFTKDRRSPDGLAPRCKWCRSDTRKSNDGRDSRLIKDRYLKWKYGISLDEYEAIKDSQGGVCAVCGNGQGQDGRKYLDVDHCHRTGKVRGLLCSHCNRALGLLSEDQSRIRKLADYIQGHHETA
jgi:hypothetical protein